MSHTIQVGSWGLLIGVLAGLTGCARPRPELHQSQWPLPPSAQRQPEQLFETTTETLRAQRFTPDRVDLRAGLISTLPETSQHFFEFWRHDVASSYDFWEASLNPIRRWVEVRFTPWPPAAETEVEVVVHKERLSSPDRQFNRTEAAFLVFAEGMPSTTEAGRRSGPAEQWVELGRDPALEQRLVRALLDRLAEPAPPDAKPDKP